MGRGRFAIAEVTGNSAPSGAAGTRTMTVDFQDPTGVWVGLNPGGAYPTMPAFEVYRVGVFDSYTYFVAPDFQLRRVRAGAGVATAEPVAINVGNLQVALGMDIDDDGAVNTWFQAPTLADATTGTPMALRITVLGRTRETVMDWEEKPATFQVEDLNINTVDRSAKWRRMQVVAMLRDFVL
jgi:hypothetical protein